MYCSFTLKGLNVNYIDSSTPPNLPLTSGYGGYYSAHFITIHTGTTSGFVANTGNCVAATWGWYDKQIILQGPNGPASSLYSHPYFKFSIRTPSAVDTIEVEVATTTGTSAYTVNYTIPDCVTGQQRSPEIVRRLLSKNLYNTFYAQFANSGLSTDGFYIWRDNGFTNYGYPNVSYMSQTESLVDGYDYCRYNILNNLPTGNYANEELSLHPKNVFRLWNLSSDNVVRNDNYVISANTYGNGIVSGNSYTANLKLHTFFYPSTGKAITNAPYTLGLSFSGFQCWRKLEILYTFFLNETTPTKIIHQGMYTFGSRANTSGVTASLSIVISKNNDFFIPNSCSGKTAYFIAYIRKYNDSEGWSEWKKAVSRTTITSIGNSYSSYPQIPINFTESSLTKPFQITITTTNCPSSIPTGRRRYSYTANIRLIRMSADTSSTEYQWTSFTMSTTYGLQEGSSTQTFTHVSRATVLERYLRSQTAKLVSIVVKNETSSSTRTFSYGTSQGLTFDENMVNYSVTMSYTSLPT